MFRCAGRCLAAVLILLCCARAEAAERLCDPAAEDCRAILLQLIQNEQQGIDVAFWFMEDARYSTALVQRAAAGVRVRVLVDSRTDSPVNAQIVAQLAGAGIPMRARTSSGILHWKMMLFAGQRTVELSGANYSPTAFLPIDPYRNYIDEAIYFTDDLSLVQSFMRRFDDLWIDTTTFENYANITCTPSRRYAQYTVDPDLNFPPAQNYRSRAVSRYRAETKGIDVIMYRITDSAHSDAMIAAVQRGVPVRLITEPQQYRDPTRLWHSWNIDRLYMAGVEIRVRAHEGLNHQKSVILKGQGMVIFGSSNWTSPSASSQEEHNYFTTKGWILDWFTRQFERKWNNQAGAPETQPFAPLPPDMPTYVQPAAGATNVALNTALVFDAGPFAHLYDVYFGTTPDPPLLEANVPLGPTPPGQKPRRYVLPPLQPNTTYFWRIVARTMALQERGQGVSMFTTGSVAPAPSPAPDPAPAPAPAPPPAPSCATPSPGTGWTCVNGGWVPPGYPIGPAAPAPSPAPAPAPAPSPAACLTPSPGAGWTCVNGGWLPPGFAAPVSTSPPPVSPAPFPPVTAACQTPSPGSGWSCVNGGWLPPGFPGVTAAPAPPTSPSPPPSSMCLTPSPGAGWVCLNGGWLPPDNPLTRGS
jgi:phosphatidylserine/phosphatidylglycerophosphate/cardiolipin synthase-like enzyme